MSPPKKILFSVQCVFSGKWHFWGDVFLGKSRPPKVAPSTPSELRRAGEAWPSTTKCLTHDL